MPTFIFKCEGCGEQKPFLVHEPPNLAGQRYEEPLQKHCARCHTVSNWVLAFSERRNGRDRRDGADRRSEM